MLSAVLDGTKEKNVQMFDRWAAHRHFKHQRVDMNINDYISKGMFKNSLGNHHIFPLCISVCKFDDLSIFEEVNIEVDHAGCITQYREPRIFQAGSISKTIFSLAVMKLATQGILNLDADVNQYLRNWQLEDLNNKNSTATIRQILSHSAGVSITSFPGYNLTAPQPELINILNGEYPANTGKVGIIGQPGQSFQYSGGGTTIVQKAVMDLLQQDFPSLMRALILEPTGMNNSTYQQSLPSKLSKKMTIGHDINGHQVTGGHHIYPEMAAAGLWSTALDLATLGMEVINTLQGNPSTLGLSQDTLESMVQPQTPDISEDSFVGLGWFCNQKDGNLCLSHAGQTEGFIAQLSLIPRENKGISIMINSLDGWPMVQHLLTDLGFSPAST